MSAFKEALDTLRAVASVWDKLAQLSSEMLDLREENRELRKENRDNRERLIRIETHHRRSAASGRPAPLAAGVTGRLSAANAGWAHRT